MPLFERVPEAWRAHLAEGNRGQARKRVSADVVFWDAEERVLLVDPVYKPDWGLPGGMAEANEPPIEAARREAEAGTLLRGYVRRRLERAIECRDGGGTAYLHDGC